MFPMLDNKRKYAPSVSESVYSQSGSLKLPAIHQKKKIVHPLLSSTGVVPLPNIINRNVNKNIISPEKVLSFKEHRLKHLDTLLADVNLQINELTKENNLLKSIQKRHESALKRYEHANGEIPKLINSHNEEMRSWQVRHDQLKIRFRDILEKTKIKDEEVLTLTRDHEHLLKQAKEAKIEERFAKRNDLKELIERSQIQKDTINTLQRRILLEEKNYRHQIKQSKIKNQDSKLKFQTGDGSPRYSSSEES